MDPLPVKTAAVRVRAGGRGASEEIVRSAVKALRRAETY
jgi:hypothetical protein